MKSSSSSSSSSILLFFLCSLASLGILFSLISPAHSHNITHILAGHPDFSTFESLLVKYGVANQINSRATITVLCPSNGALASIVPKLSDPQTAFAVLSYHVLLDYFDLAKLKSITNGTALVATLYQTTGSVPGNGGFMNVTNVKGTPMLGLAAPGSHLSVSVAASIAQYPYNISVLSVTQVMVPEGVVLADASAPTPAPSQVNISHVIEQSGNHSTFLSLLAETGVNKVLQSHDVAPGITCFAPSDAAFNALPAGVLKNLTSAEKVALLEYHCVPSFYPVESLVTLAGSPVPTLVGDPAYTFDVLSKAGSPTINTGFNVAPVGSTLYAKNPVAIYTINSVLLPSVIFGLAPTSAPSPSPVPSPSPSLSPSPTPVATPSSTPSPSTLPSSPPAPPPTPEVRSTPGPNSNDTGLAAPTLSSPWVPLLSMLLLPSLALFL